VRTALLLGAAAALLAGCGSAGKAKEVKEVAVNVLTLQWGDVGELRERRGSGPFRDYDVPPSEALAAAEAALRSKVVAVFPNPRALEVVAKERKPELADETDYAPPWVSAVVVIVHPVADDPGRSRVEVHATQRGTFHFGVIDWEREIPPLIDRLVAERKAARGAKRP
jgi:hypothetical protein